MSTTPGARAARPSGAAREGTLLALAAALLAALVIVAAPPGTDYAAHAYQSGVFRHSGLVLWDNRWYAGRYAFITYSLLYYPLAALLGIAAVAILSSALTVGLVADVFAVEWGRAGRLGARTFAVAWPAFLLTAAYPFTLGTLFAALACWALQRGRTAVACASCALSLAASPLAFALLALILAGAVAAKRPAVRSVAAPAITVVALGALEQLLWRAFPSAGRNPFPLGAMLAAVAFCAVIVLLARGAERARTLAWVFACNGAATVLAFAVPSAIGQGIARFQFFALPVAVLAISLGGGGRQRRLLCVAALALGGWINLPPLISSLVDGTRTSAATAAYWQPAVDFLRAHASPAYRVEAVDTVGHWPAVYLAGAGVPLARGWFRQDDFPQNAVLYRRPSGAEYADWLQLMGVRYVVLADATPDYSALQEARLIRSGRAGLRLVDRTPHAAIYAVRAPGSLVVGLHPARVTSLTQTGLTVALGGAGTYRLAIRFTPYWRPSRGCVGPTPDGMTLLTVRHAARVRLRFAWSADRALSAAVGADAAACRS